MATVVGRSSGQHDRCASSLGRVLFLEDIEEPEVEAVLDVLRQHGIK